MNGTPHGTPQDTQMPPESPSTSEYNISSPTCKAPVAQIQILMRAPVISQQCQWLVTANCNPHLPINNTETLLKKLHCHPSVHTTARHKYTQRRYEYHINCTHKLLFSLYLSCFLLKLSLITPLCTHFLSFQDHIVSFKHHSPYVTVKF